MKQFKNLFEVLEYQPICPLCQERVMPVSANLNYDENKVIATLTIGNITLVVDCHNNNVLQYSESSSMNGVYTIGTQMVTALPSGNYALLKGNNVFRLNMTCDKCSRYGYLTQVHVDGEQYRVTGLFLNSESISIEEGTKLYEVKNVYAVDKTELSIFHQHLSSKRGAVNKIEFPIIPLDLQNPMKTIDRIKNLIAFL